MQKVAGLGTTIFGSLFPPLAWSYDCAICNQRQLTAKEPNKVKIPAWNKETREFVRWGTLLICPECFDKRRL